MKKTAILTGSFDPVTVGHEELIRRAARLFDRVYVVILANTEKKSGLFPPKERLLFLQTVADALNEESADAPEKSGVVEAVLYDGPTSEAAKRFGADVIVRGVRNATDFDYEYSLANIMKRFDPTLETLFLPASPELSCVSSTYARELLKYGFPLDGSVPGCAAEQIAAAYAAQIAR